MRTETPTPIVVGIDGSPPSCAAPDPDSLHHSHCPVVVVPASEPEEAP